MKWLTILAVCCIAIGHIGYGQTPMEKIYEYDASGNRILHHVITFRNQLLQADSNEEDTTGTAPAPYYTGQIGTLQLNVYPNPTLGQVNVQILNSEEAVSGSIRVYTLWGQLLRMQQVDAPNCTIDLSIEPVGTYLVKVQLNNFEQEWKIIKE
jgi:hypothetical protein